ncbi:hypothetical protein DPEC_G00350210 [Dallia pectoralis]|uniref:Uncharacterized protein n=1 Tax=Dallia pectoralis TaxID=75939 RepID=A0ACC2F1M9_DALPE|nr:hypothetical protein DPEC_G00350210 [Dallia pectoralis]
MVVNAVGTVLELQPKCRFRGFGRFCAELYGWIVENGDPTVRRCFKGRVPSGVRVLAFDGSNYAEALIQNIWPIRTIPAGRHSRARGQVDGATEALNKPVSARFGQSGERKSTHLPGRQFKPLRPLQSRGEHRGLYSSLGPGGCMMDQRTGTTQRSPPPVSSEPLPVRASPA